MNARAIRCVIGLVGVSLLPLSVTAQSTSTTTDGDRTQMMSGSFHYVGGDGQRRDVHDKIEHIVSQMNVVKRPMARGRIAARNPVFSSIEIRFPPGAIEVVSDGRALRSPDNGSSAPARAVTGESIQVRHRLHGNRLIETLTSSEGTRRNEYVLDGSSLTMHVTMSSPQLPEPLNYELNYQK